MGVILSRPEPMVKIQIVAFKEDYEELVLALQRIGVLHIERTEDGKEGLERLRERVALLEEASELVEEAEEVLGEKIGGIDEPPDIVARLAPESLERARRAMERVKRLLWEADRLETAARREEALSTLLRELSERLGGFDVEHLNYRGRSLEISTWLKPGKTGGSFSPVPEASILALTDTGLGRVVVLLYMPRDSGLVEQVMRERGYRRLLLGSLKGGLDTVSRRLAGRAGSLRKAALDARDEAKRLLLEHLYSFRVLKSFVLDEKPRLEALRRMLSFRVFMAVQGWVPLRLASRVVEELWEKGLHVYMEFWEPQPGLDYPPTKLSNPEPLKPFELLTELYGLPEYWEWDPTPLLAYSFSILFGLMLADVGYGAVLALLSLLVLPRLAGEGENAKRLQRMMLIAGIVSAVIGVLSGGFFGDLMAEILPSPILDFSDPAGAILFSLVVGLVHVNLAHILAVMRGIREREWGKAASEMGLLMAELGGIPLIAEGLLDTEIPMLSGLGPAKHVVLVVGLILLVGGSIASQGGVGLLMWLFSVTGLLGDVMSYTRIAGIGMATYYLAYSFNIMGRMLYKGVLSTLHGIPGMLLGGVLAGGVLALTHLVNLALGAMGSFIHSMRLCYVEFIPKFYKDGGRKFEPLRPGAASQA